MAITLNPVNAWDMKLAAVSETTFGTTPTPADVAAVKARFLECVNANLGGAAQVGVVRSKQDRGIGRGHTDAFVEGRVEPIDFSVALSPPTPSIPTCRSPAISPGPFRRSGLSARCAASAMPSASVFIHDQT